jgi:hypothetical protein
LNDGGDVGVAGRSTRKQLAKALRATLNGSLTEPRAVGRTWRGHHCSKKEPRRSGAVVSITSTAGPPLRTDNVDPGGSVPGSCRFRRLWLLNYFCIHRRPLIRAQPSHFGLEVPPLLLARADEVVQTYRAAAAYAVRQPLLGATMGYAYFDQATITALPIPGACVPHGIRRADERNGRNSVLRSPRLCGHEASALLPWNRRTTRLALRDVSSIAAETGVIGQFAPWNHVLFRAHAKESAKGHHSIGDTTADLFDHQSLDAANIAALRIVNGCASDAQFPVGLADATASSVRTKLGLQVKPRDKPGALLGVGPSH